MVQDLLSFCIPEALVPFVSNWFLKYISSSSLPFFVGSTPKYVEKFISLHFLGCTPQSFNLSIDHHFVLFVVVVGPNRSMVDFICR